MKKIQANIMVSSVLLGVGLASCDGNLLDNAPVPTRLYFVVSEATLANCTNIELSGIIGSSMDAAERNKDNFHISTKASGYAKTPLATNEVLNIGNPPETLVLKRLGTYSTMYFSTFRYNWILRLTCQKTGTVSNVVLTGAFKELNRAALITPVTTASGEISVMLKEFPLASTPEQLNLP
ncbi:hypothetical protein [Deinococcus sp. QL22]|uniref:hypothetical protein n=1 Tax=Deinococcus sp. QL22 TaxID=2939437 RepID=UPI002017F278|nr:hypothetical protein [Deinococcus sp. QL22]UQN10695.1 hypothetical protein M1R55_30455 [Deinococcus sp. QL22]